MIEYLKHTNKAGEFLALVPMVQYPINESQTILVFCTQEEPLELDGHGVVEWNLIGRLDDQNLLLDSMTRNSLVRDGWDFETYPNPFVALGDKINQTND